MRTRSRIAVIASAMALLAALPAGALAQDTSDTTTVSVVVSESQPLLTMSATYTAGASNVTTNGGTAHGELVIAVQDNRSGNDGWNVYATMGPFTRGGVANPAAAMVEFSLSLTATVGPDFTAVDAAPLNAPNENLMSAPAKTSGSAIWNTAASFSPGLETGTYHAQITFDLYGVSPP
jgi:hypothetical protein